MKRLILSIIIISFSNSIVLAQRDATNDTTITKDIEIVKEYNPECVAIELDEQRYKALNDAENWKNLDIIKVLKNNQGFLLLANPTARQYLGEYNLEAISR